MDVHRERVELRERGHAAQQKHHHAPALDRLDRAREQARRERLKVLEDEHAKGLPQHAVRVGVVAVPDGRGRDEERKGVLLLRVLRFYFISFILFVLFWVVVGD